ncbi:MAG: PDZ domain-containing protein [Caldilineae bacterium]|nr:MAG: PDZ domain-containing protein [Caldilineae bacterium]
MTAAAQATPTPVPPTPTPKPTDTPTPAPTPTPSKVVSSLDDVQKAVIQIEAQGSFVDPAEGLMLNVAGRGSGFIIDESGIAVTNNHVVTGAALLKVWVGGEDKPRNAKILGVSECSDLAIIDIEGDGYPYFEWYDGEIKPGLDVYAAGFPLGNPEFTLTRGIVSKAHANGETNWASVDAVIEHDATINPGNSGGPLVTADGKVVGVNYAGSSDTGQFFAIARDEALPVIKQLRQGEDVESLGVNGIAVNNGEGLSGIWVSSVKSGSPADKVGLKGGDIITAIEGLVLATDGTMADYCDILRTHEPDDVLNVQVLRFDTQEVLEGQFNGRELELSFSFAQELGGEVSGGETGGGGGAAPAGYDYVTLVDDDNAIQLEVPAQWSDTNGSNWLFEDQVVGSALSASPNFDDFLNTYSTPGVFFAASSVLTQRYDVNSLLDRLQSNLDCEYGGRKEYSDELYTGAYDLYSKCGDSNSVIIDLVAEPADGSFLIWVDVQVVSDADLDALDHILNSFQVIGPLPGGSAAAPPPPTATPVPSSGSASNLAPQPGRSRIYVVNKYSEELTFTINNQEHKVAVGTEYPVDLDAGKYTYTISVPFGSVNGEVDMPPNTSWAIMVDENGSVFKPVQVYP